MHQYFSPCSTSHQYKDDNDGLISPGAMDLEEWAACQSEEQDRSAHQEGDDDDFDEDIEKSIKLNA